MSDNTHTPSNPRVQRRVAPTTPADAPAALPESPDLGALLAPEPEPPPPPLARGQAVSGPIRRVAGDAVFLELGEGRTGVLPRTAFMEGPLPRVGDVVHGVVRVPDDPQGHVLLNRAEPAEAPAAAPAPEVIPAPAPEAPKPVAAKPAAPKPAPRPPAKVAPAPLMVVEDEDFASLLADHLDDQPRITEGNEVRGAIVKISDEVLFINLGAKTEGIIDTAEFKDADGKLTVKVGDEIQAYVVNTGMEEGGIRLSRSFGSGPNPLDAVRDAFELGVPIEGRISGRNKGGFEVKIGSVRAFLPVSHLEIGRIPDEKLDDYIGQSFTFKIMRIKGRDVVLSRQELLKAEAAQTVARLKEELREGAIVKGRVRSVKEYGAFVELAPGLDGLIHVSEMSWGRVNKPEEVVSVGQEVTARVLKYDPETNRLSLGLKQLTGDPWDAFAQELREGQVLTGTVERLMPFGAFIRIADGVEGLLHISNMSWEKRINRPNEVVQVGDTVQVQVLSVDLSGRRIALGMKQLATDPWDGVEVRFAPGTRVEGSVEKIEKFGVFVMLEPGLTGLLPLSEIDPKAGGDLRRSFPVNGRVQVVVLEVDPERRRLTLSHKALHQDEEKASFKSYQEKVQSAPAESKTGFGTLAFALKTATKGRGK